MVTGVATTGPDGFTPVGAGVLGTGVPQRGTHGHALAWVAVAIRPTPTMLAVRMRLAAAALSCLVFMVSPCLRLPCAYSVGYRVKDVKEPR